MWEVDYLSNPGFLQFPFILIFSSFTSFLHYFQHRLCLDIFPMLKCFFFNVVLNTTYLLIFELYMEIIWTSSTILSDIIPHVGERQMAVQTKSGLVSGFTENNHEITSSTVHWFPSWWFHQFHHNIWLLFSEKRETLEMSSCCGHMWCLRQSYNHYHRWFIII